MFWKGGMMLKKWIVVVLFVLIGVLVIQNIQSVTIQFLFWKASMSRVSLLDSMPERFSAIQDNPIAVRLQWNLSYMALQIK